MPDPAPQDHATPFGRVRPALETANDRDPPQPDDPVYLHSRREAVIILATWAVCLVWTTGYSYFSGYDAGEKPISQTFGMPSWVFLGVLVPWVAATVFSVWFSLFVMKDDDLGETGEDDQTDGVAGEVGHA